MILKMIINAVHSVWSFYSLMRCGWVYTVALPGLLKPTKVKLQRFATSTAKVVAAETANKISAPHMAVFCTISKLARLVTAMQRSRKSGCLAVRAPSTLLAKMTAFDSDHAMTSPSAGAVARR